MLRKLTASLLALGVAAAVSAQGPCFDPVLGTDLGLGDDASSAALPLGFSFVFNGVTYTDIVVCSNGYIWFGSAAGANDWSPTEGELLTQAPRFCPLWNDFNPAAVGGGHVYFDNATPGIARVTWNGVYTFGTTTPTSMQVVFDAASNITVTYGSLGPASTAQGGTTIIGASPGAGAVSNPVSFAALPLFVTGDTFAEVIATPAGTSAPYANSKWLFTPTSPGYLINDVPCTPNSLPGLGSSQSVGLGCPSRSGPSLYEVFSGTNPADLNGRDLSYLPIGAQDYLAIPGLSATWFAGFAGNLNLTDDSVAAVTLPFSFPYNGGTETTIQVSSNGFLTIGVTNPGSGCCTGSVANMLAGAPRVSGWWEDLNPSAGGAVYGDLDPATGEYVVTWNAVPEFNTANLNTFQIALSPSGQITHRWQTVGGANGPYLVGFSRGGNTPDSGATDLSAVTSSTISSAIQLPLELAAASGSRPQVGGTFTTNVSGIQSLPNGVFSVQLISTEVPGGLPLDGLGLSGCTAYIALPELVSFFSLTLGNPTTSFAVSIPNDPAFYGVSLMSQAISDDLTANAFGYRVSNGLRWNFGL